MSTTDSRARTRKDPAERASEILEAATALAQESGLGALTLRAVAQRAGVASGLIAHYQPSMDDLVARVYGDLVAEEIREIRGLLAEEAGPAARMARLIVTLLDGSREDLTVVWVESWAMARRNQALAAAVREQMSRWQRLLVEVVDEGCEREVFRTDQAADVAWQIMGMIDGINAQSLVRDVDPATAITQTARAAETLLGARAGSLDART